MITDFPIISYLKSSNEICLINLLNPSQPQKLINIHPYIFICFVKSDLLFNKTLFHREYEQESHIPFLAKINEDGPLELLIIRIDVFDQLKRGRYETRLKLRYEQDEAAMQFLRLGFKNIR